jgi:hypothetical protein
LTILPRMRESFCKSGLSASAVGIASVEAGESSEHNTLLHWVGLIGTRFRLDNLHVTSRPGVTAAVSEDT